MFQLCGKLSKVWYHRVGFWRERLEKLHQLLISHQDCVKQLGRHLLLRRRVRLRVRLLEKPGIIIGCCGGGFGYGGGGSPARQRRRPEEQLQDLGV